MGVVVMDENRLFANETKYVTNMGALVKRDRNHVSARCSHCCLPRHDILSVPMLSRTRFVEVLFNCPKQLKCSDDHRVLRSDAVLPG